MILLLTFGCGDPGTGIEDPLDPLEGRCPIDGSQIGEPDCEGVDDRLEITLSAGGAPVEGVVAWTRYECATVTLDCPDGSCQVIDPAPGDYEVVATVGDLSLTVELTLDEADRIACSECCEGDALVEQLTFTF